MIRRFFLFVSLVLLLSKLVVGFAYSNHLNQLARIDVISLFFFIKFEKVGPESSALQLKPEKLISNDKILSRVKMSSIVPRNHARNYNLKRSLIQYFYLVRSPAGTINKSPYFGLRAYAGEVNFVRIFEKLFVPSTVRRTLIYSAPPLIIVSDFDIGAWTISGVSEDQFEIGGKRSKVRLLIKRFFIFDQPEVNTLDRKIGLGLSDSCLLGSLGRGVCGCRCFFRLTERFTSKPFCLACGDKSSPKQVYSNSSQHGGRPSTPSDRIIRIVEEPSNPMLIPVILFIGVAAGVVLIAEGRQTRNDVGVALGVVFVWFFGFLFVRVILGI